MPTSSTAEAGAPPGGPDAPGQDAPSPDAPSLVALFLVFNKLSLVSFGGGLSAWARRIVVEDKRWLDDAEFLSAYALARVMPGANQANFAIYVGQRFRGPLGALSAVLGLTAVPFCIVLGLAWLYFGSGHVPAVQDVLHGVTAAAVGLALSMGFKTGEVYARQPVALLFIAAAFLGSIALDMPLWAVLLVLGPLGFWREWRAAGRAARGAVEGSAGGPATGKPAAGGPAG